MPASPGVAACLVFAALILVGCGREELQPTMPDTRAPLPPSGLMLESAGDGYIFFSWEQNTESDLAGYIVWRSEQRDSALFAAVDTVDGNWIVDGGRSYDTTYHYRVSAIDRAGNQSPLSRVLTARSPNLSAPAAPRELYAQGRNDGITAMIRVSWEPVNEYDLTGYKVFRSDNPMFSPDSSSFLAFTERAVYDDTHVADVSRDYTYVVVAIDRGGLVSTDPARATDHVTGIPQLLSPPDGAQIPSNTVFRWSAAAGAVQYRLIVTSSPDAGEVWSGSVDGDGSTSHALQYSGPPLAIGRTYTWRVAALSQKGGEANGISERRMFLIAP